MKRNKRLDYRFPPSEACSCDICRSYCQRPGWWTVEEASAAFEAGLGGRMMLEISPELDFGVLSPAFRGCEGGIASGDASENGCGFHRDGLCELHPTGHMPLECRFCHHDRPGLGKVCHGELEKDWKTKAGQALVGLWITAMKAKAQSRR